MSRLPGIVVDRELTSDDWYTPPSLFEALGDVRFDLDVCAPEGGLPWIPADRSLSFQDDGLTAPWDGFVWMNPPYSSPAPWLARMAAHNNGLALVAAYTATAAWEKHVYDKCSSVIFLRHRIKFIRPNTDKSSTGMFPSVLLAYGPEAHNHLLNSHLQGMHLQAVPREAV